MKETVDSAYRRIGEMTLFELGVALTQMGIKTTYQEAFRKAIPEDYTADTRPIIDQWSNEMQRKPSLDETVFMQVAATKLWMTWCPEKPCDMFLEMSYEDGYESWGDDDDESALEHWTRFMILLERRFKGATSIESALTKIDQLLGGDWELWFEDYRMLINNLLPPERVLKIEAKLVDLEKPIEDITIRKIRTLEKKIDSRTKEQEHKD
ncbi:hypothetical protein WDW86_01100 [Bdellovibrionota bacterium FG-2]